MSRSAPASGRPLRGSERPIVALLGIPTLALALAVTMVTTYLPVVAHNFVGSRVVIGVIVGIEGLLALWLPLVVGAWSDRLDTRIGGRLPFLLAGGPVLILGLIGMGFIGAIGGLTVAALVFFIGYFLAYEPYRALYPDTIPDEVEGRAQGLQALWRGAGTGLALLGGGLLLGLGQAAPFLAVAVVYAIAMGAFAVVLARRGVPHEPAAGGGVRDGARAVIGLIRGARALRAFLAANALWELSLGALKTFVVLYVTAGLGFSRSTAALLIAGVAVVVLLAALASGKLADRFGPTTVLRAALPVYGLGLLIPLLFADRLLVALSIPFVATGGGVIMALPYAVLIPLMPEHEHGALTGFYSLSRGIGTWLGPLLGGVAITVLAGPFSATQGYQAMWLVCSASVLLSLWPLQRLRAEEQRRDGASGG
jgi:MFS family permease